MKRLALIVVGVAALTSFKTAAQTPAPHTAPTFAKDVASIMFNKCATCHRPGEVAPMSLLSYEDARPWAKAIKGKVVAREMPPWGADMTADACRCATTSASRRRRSTRSRRGSMAAPRRAMPPTCRPTPKFATGWTAGTEPDLVLEMPVEFDIPAEGELGVQMFYSKVPWTEDRFAEIVELKPSNRAVLHHAGIFFVDIPEGASIVNGRIVDKDGKVIGDRGSRGLPSTDSGLPGSSKLLSWVPGRGLDHHRADIGKRLPAGKYINWQLHYNPTGKPEKDRTQARHLVQQGAGDARSADPPGRRSAGDDEGRLVDLSRRRPRGGIQGRPEQHAPQPDDAEHSAVRRELATDRHHAGDRRHHALCDVAAHAPARQELEVGDRLSRRHARRRSSTCRSSTSTGSSTTS